MNIFYLKILVLVLSPLSSVFDSWTKMQSGLLTGHTQDLGNFDQCVKLRHDSHDDDIGNIIGKYCLVYYTATEKSNSSSDWSRM